MLSQETLLESTESYLKALVADTSASLGTDFDSAAPFRELGIDSFRVLKIIKVLEADFGTLPKTLLFENFNVDSLARYFVDRHHETLSARFSQDQRPVRPARDEHSAKPMPAPEALRKTPIRLLEKDLVKHPELDALVQALFERHKNEGCVSRGTRNIAPNLFIGSGRKGYFNYCRGKNIVLVYAYTGPEDYFPEIAGEMVRYCAEKSFQLNFFSLDPLIPPIDGIAFSATPIGALQRVLDVQNFTLQGGAMRRLRYQVSKFEKEGACRTQEYKSGTDPAVDGSIAEIIDRWCATKPMVNPLIHIVREEILAGVLNPQHRIFLTYLDDSLQNVILIAAMCDSLNGYLMDLEFYGKDMPLGGLEYAIVKIIEALAAEGRGMLSLGGTYGCRLETSPHADPEVDRVLDDLHKQNIFNDEGNLQFKNKFRPENKSIYLCRPIGGGKADNVIDIIMMIADPARAQTSDEENHNAAVKLPIPKKSTAASAPRFDADTGSRTLQDVGFNPMALPNDRIDFDLKTDSWAQLRTAPFVAKQMGHLRALLQQPINLNDSLAAIFPFKHVVLTDAGRTADHLLCKAWPKPGIVPQNLLFPSCIYHQIDNGFTPRELPHAEVFRWGSEEVYKANLNWDALRDCVARQADEIAYVCIEVSDNAAGGHPVSVQHLKQVKELLAGHCIALVIDGTRVLENAQFLIEHEPSYAGRTLWEVAREILSYADVVIGSLAKNFCVDKGGVIATNDEQLFRRVQSLIQQEGGGLNVIEKKLVALALQKRKQIEAAVVQRMRAVETIWRTLRDEHVPVVQPVGGHCVIIDVKQLPEFRNLEAPVASFLAWLYLNTGIRAGAHSVGMQKYTAINDQVRLAIPVGLNRERVEEIVSRLVRSFRDKRDIPELKLRGSASESIGEMNAQYDLVGYLGGSQTTVAAAAPVTAAARTPEVPRVPTAAATDKSVNPSISSMDIAIIGMAGRYPNATNLREFWENLRQGRDCVGEMPKERLARRLQNEFTRSYRGGFLENVDKFDSLFFNISPREAEALDPQERLFLEVAWETLEDAGYYPETLAQESGSRNVGVFVGAVWAMYQIAGVEQKLSGNDVNPNSFLWSIANRVSYCMNLTGPSLTVDTACSSSLTALYLACESIRSGGCSSAIVGGVNLDLHQSKFDINNAGGALSSDGLCRSFGAGANGYVAGEGVGALFIKPLERALADNDNIYGVIKSVAANHGGRTSGYTVPNPKAQGEVVASALEKAGLDARTIGYIEAHGTGTELGDPIEISGLANAFQSHQVGKQSCAIGSVKANIGHLEAAAGVVGMSKVLLQMRHRQLVPSLHSEQLNEHIDFKNSPFYVQRQLQTWDEKEIDGVRYPLRAGISSFGAGGANAHVVVESLELPAIAPTRQADSYLFPLSARNDEQLRDMATRLRSHLVREVSPQGLLDIAFTLQNGRKSFEYRLAIVAKTQPELVGKLDLFLRNQTDADVLAGHAKNSQEITKLLSRKEKEQFIGLLAASRDPRKLARLWIDGLLADCRAIQQLGGRRTSLPTYPFADKRHWIGAETTSLPVSLQTRAGVHPLIDSNESTFHRQLFKKTFHRQQFILRDHLVSGIPTLPGTAYLDMVRKAGEIASGRKVQKIRNVTWVSPLSVEDAPLEAMIELKPSADSASFEVYSEDADGRRKLFSQGKLAYANEQAPEAEYIDIASIRARCSRTISGSAAYPLFSSVGLSYGASFQALREVYKSNEEMLGLLQLPDVRGADFDQFVLHPCLLDASMQAGVVGQLGEASGEMKVPYSIGEVEILHPLTRTCYSHVTKMKSDRNTGSGVSRENVSIVDETGKVLVRIRESIGVPLSRIHERPASIAVEPARAEEAFAKLYYSHVWQKSPLAEAASDVRSLLMFDTNDRLRDACVQRDIDAILVLPSDDFADLGNDTYGVNPRNRHDFIRLFEALSRRNWTAEKICYAWPEAAEPGDESALRKGLARGVYAFLFLCQALIEQKPASRVQVLYLYSGRADTLHTHNDAINGFVRSLRLEHPKIDGKVLEMRQDGSGANDALDAIVSELHTDAQEEITVRYENRVRQARTLRRLGPAELWSAESPGMALKQNGVYLITGGAGGLGLIFAEFLARQCRAKLVLTGRSELSTEVEARLEDLRTLGAEVRYVAADVSKSEDVQRLMQRCNAQFGAINGIIHAAGVLRDSFFRKKSAEEMQAVFAPKILGAFHLDEQTRDVDLDFFVLFSSLAAIGGNAGQCDYSFANHYLDSFAAQREALRVAGKRAGRTLSLNWSLWADGGMKLDEPTEAFFRKSLGIKPLNKEVGLEAFVGALSTGHSQLAVLEGVRTKIEQAWGLAKKQAAPVMVSEVAAAAGRDNLPELVIGELSKLVMSLLKLDADDLSLDSILLDLGFDSIGLTTFANAINDKYRLDINPTLFFEYPSIREIAGVLATEHAGAVRKTHGGGGAAVVEAMSSTLAAPTEAADIFAIDKNVVEHSAPATSRGDLSRQCRFVDMPIAIVGIAGVMPQSDNVEEFWDNLKNARNLVTEIPRDRWIWEDYDGNPIKEVNKSNSRWGGFMKQIDKFDPLFFGITPREAEMMDPQQRIFIETVWSAIEDSGHKVSDLSGTKTGLFVGVSAKDYTDVLAENHAALDGFSASGNSHSILANRVSFLFNLRGPSAPLDTACSSSLIALHRAIESIHTGSSDMAIVGGVQVMLTPVGHISLSSAGMLSVEGKCKTFDKDANGYVRGEGAGAILIKPLAQAEADGNPIYAVIKATAENHGGRVTMLTAPNPKAHAELIAEAYEKAQVDPATIGYMECHGTGTSLGDPIEIQGLKKSFSELYRKHNKAPPTAPHCGLTSVKTNIGHLEPAAGIASLLKVLMSLKHRQIPGLLHMQELNPYIDLSGSPFYIVDKTMPWNAITDRNGAPVPRRAGVSSFGWGGANAHVVLEEYQAPTRQRSDQPSRPQLIVLSARNEDRLKAYARSLLEHIQTHEVELADLAYTLQVGRDSMEERLGMIVDSMEELVTQLDAYLEGETKIDAVYRGRITRHKRNDQGLSVMASDQGDSSDDIDGWIASGNFTQVLGAWVNGTAVEWSRFHAVRPKRMSLPTYPFARHRHWIETNTNAKAAAGATAAALHPLLHINTSTFNQQRYSSTFSGKEFFLADHGKSLPVAAYLEMARAAVAQARRTPADATIVELRDVQWTPGASVGEQPPVVIELFERRQGQIDYEIHSADAIHCQGTVKFDRRPAATKFDLQQLKALMAYGVVESNRVDAALNAMRPNRGPLLSGIKAIYRGHLQLLVRLDLPAGVEDTQQAYVLHPAMMDSVMQSAFLLAGDLDPMSGQSSTPSTLASLSVLSPCTREMYAWVHYSRDSGSQDPTLRLDIDLMDAQGAVCIKMKSLAFANRRAADLARAAQSEDFVALLESVYQAEAANSDNAANDASTGEFAKILEEIF